MKNYWKAIGIATLAAGVLYYPVAMLVKYLSADKKAGDEENKESHTHIVKAFSPAYRGKKDHFKRHNHNGHLDSGHA